MKKILSLFTFWGLLMTVACKKDKTMPPIEPMDITVPSIVFPMPNLAIEWSGWLQFKGIPFNFDSTIRGMTANKFSMDNVRSITVKSINLELLNADADNNLANFERVEVLLSIRSADDLRLQGSSGFDTAYASSSPLQPNAANLKPSIDSLLHNSLMYIIAGDVRRNTKAMNAKVDIVYHLE